MLYNEEEDHFDARWAIQLIAKRKLKEKLLQHIEQYTYYDGTERLSYNGYYLGLTTMALRFLRECGEEDTAK